MKKSLTIVGVLLVLVCVLTVITYFTKKDDNEYIEYYLEDDGYEYSEEGEYYHKALSDITMDEYFDRVANNKASEYEELYFYSGSYKLTKLKMSYANDINYHYTVDYNLINSVITYKYEISIYSSSIILGGSYMFGDDDNEDKFTCEVINTQLMSESGKEAYCTRAKYETILFLEDANSLLGNPRFASIIEKGYTEAELTE